MRDFRLIETEAIIVAYAMSRLNQSFLSRFNYPSWRAAFDSSGATLGVPPGSMKNLRDEFDPFHGFRKGWHKRPLRPNRQRVLSEFSEVPDDDLLEIVDRLLRGEHEATADVIQPLALGRERIHNVAERLRTGRIAEEYFMRHSDQICGVSPSLLLDRRQNAMGFDFGVSNRPLLAIEVKGLKPKAGSILFTELEWETAQSRREEYWLVVVGNLDANPCGKLWRDPASTISVSSTIIRSTSIAWKARISVI